MNTRKDRFSKKILETPPSGIRKFFDLIIGRDDIISLGVGEPDFPTPWSIREEGVLHKAAYPLRLYCECGDSGG